MSIQDVQFRFNERNLDSKSNEIFYLFFLGKRVVVLSVQVRGQLP